MTEFFARRTPYGLVPVDDIGRETLAKIKLGDTCVVAFRRPRNLAMHRKYFALLQIAFDAWEPPQTEWRGLPVQKHFDRFRKDVEIAAGFYDPVVNLKGEVRAEPRSLRFASMSQDEFETLYDKTIDVLLQYALHGHTREDVRQWVAESIMEFAA